MCSLSSVLFFTVTVLCFNVLCCLGRFKRSVVTLIRNEWMIISKKGKAIFCEILSTSTSQVFPDKHRSGAVISQNTKYIKSGSRQFPGVFCLFFNADLILSAVIAIITAVA